MVEPEEEVVLEDYDCIERGAYPWGRGGDFTGDDYQGQTRTAKMNQLWSKLHEEQTVICQQYDEMNDFFSQSPRTSFGSGIEETDEMPGQRNKLVHQ